MPLQRRPPGMHFLLGFPVFPELTNWVAGSPSNHKVSSMSTHFGTVRHPVLKLFVHLEPSLYASINNWVF